MFTLEQIKQAHSKVKSGADFPEYFQKIKKLGVSQYETFVYDGHTNFFGVNTYSLSSPAKYESLAVNEASNAEQFKADLKAHQQGKTDFLTFCNQCARAGINKWIVRMNQSTCIYYDKAGNEILAETIPH